MGKKKAKILTYGDYTLNQEKFDKLIGVADKQEQTTLKVLYNAVVKCINDLNANSTAVSVKDWEATKNTYEQYTDKLWTKYFPAAPEDESPKLENLKAVIKHLTTAGWKIKKSTLYNHKEKGLLRPDKEGKYSQAAVDKYALAAKLKRLDGKKTEKLEKMSEDRQSAETRKLNAQAEREELKLKVEKGLFVPKDTFERELAHRAMVFKTDGEAFFRSQASAMIKLTGGDPEKAPDLIEFGLNAFAGWLNRYPVDREFIVPAPASEDILQDPDEEKEDVTEE